MDGIHDVGDMDGFGSLPPDDIPDSTRSSAIFSRKHPGNHRDRRE